MTCRTFALALTFFSALAFGQTIERPILFSLSKDGQTSYLLGTFHLGINFSELPKSVVTKLESRAVFMSEASLLGEKDGPTPSYEQVPRPTPETAAKLQARGVSPLYLKVIEAKPGLGCMLYLYTELFGENAPAFSTFDEQIFKFAKQAGKTLVDLDDESVESVSETLSLCDVNSLANEITPE
jgi:uncharacterized protein YbaP (TraB family)